MKKLFLITLSFFAVQPIFAADLACKLYNRDHSTQLRSDIRYHKAKETETYLVFNGPISFHRDLKEFKVVYSTFFSNSTGPGTIVAHGKSPNRFDTQAVIIKLGPLQGHVRYGKVRAGDFNSRLVDSLGKYRSYDIQCFYRVNN